MKSDTELSGVVDGSNESLYYPGEELDPNFKKTFKKWEWPGLKSISWIFANKNNILVSATEE